MFKFKKATLKDELKIRHGTYFTYGTTIFKIFMFGDDKIKLAFYDEQSRVAHHLDMDYTVKFIQEAIIAERYRIIQPENGEILIPNQLKNYVIQD